MKLLYNEEELFSTKQELLNFKITLPLAKLDIVGSRLVSNGLMFSDHIPVDICLVIFSELSIGSKTKKFCKIISHL